MKYDITLWVLLFLLGCRSNTPTETCTLVIQNETAIHTAAFYNYDCEAVIKKHLGTEAHLHQCNNTANHVFKLPEIVKPTSKFIKLTLKEPYPDSI
jgi:hypothetical protein